MVQDHFGEGVDLHSKLQSFTPCWVGGVRLSLGVRKTISAIEYWDGLETKLESHWDGDLWMIRVQQRRIQYQSFPSWDLDEPNSLFSNDATRSTGPHAFSPSLSLCCLSSLPLPSFFLIPPLFSLLFCFTFLIRSLSIWMVWSLLQKWIPGGKKSKFWETSCHPWICTNQHKCVCWSPRGLTIPCTALWGLAKRTILCECNMFPSFPSFCDLKETGKNQRTKVMQCSPPKTAMELGFENPCSCIWVSNSASSAGQRVPGLPPVY